MTLTDTIERFLDTAARGEVRDAAACFAPEAVLVVPSTDGDLRFEGRTEIEAALVAARAAFSDVVYTANRRYVAAGSLTEEGRVAARHSGPFAGVEADGAEVDVPLRMIAEADPDDDPDEDQPDNDDEDTDGSDGGARERRARGDVAIRRLTVWVDRPALMQQLGVDIEGNAAAAAVAVVGLRNAGGGDLQVIEGSAAQLGAEPPARSRRAAVAAVVVALLLLLGAAGVSVVRSMSSDSSTNGSARQNGSAAGATAKRAAPTATGSALPRVAVQNPDVAPTVQAGQQVVLGADVLFEFDSAKLTPAARSAIAAVASRIRANHMSGTIQVNGYTDNIGSATYARDLSRRRALAVAVAMRPELAGLTVRLQPQGFGSADPVASNATKSGQARNRRVTIVLPKQ